MFTAPRARALLAALPFLLPAASALAQSDSCASATPVTQGAYSGSTAAATNDGSADCGSSAASPDLWYRFNSATACGLRVDLCGSAYDTVLSVHTACPGSPANQVACNDDTGGSCGLGSTVLFSVAAGQSYFLRVSGFAGATGAFTLNLSACTPASPTDSCTLARTVAQGTVTDTTLAATNDGSATCGASEFSPDIWFAFTPTDNCPVQVETCGSTFDTVLSVHTSCPGLDANQIVCNDDACPNFNSRVFFNASAGTRYLLRVAGYNGATGNVTLTVQQNCAPPGTDSCSAATELSPGTVQVSTSGATTDGASSCDSGAPGPDVWFRYTPAADCSLRVNTCNSSFDTILSVHTACPGTALNQVACNDDTCAQGSSVLVNATAGAPYYIRLTGFNGAAGTAQVQLRCDPPGTGGPDAYMGELGAMVQLGRLGDTVGCAIDTPLCNAGTDPLDTIVNPDPRHPFFVFNMYRLQNGRLEQVGQSWAKHMFGAAQGDFCGFGCTPYPNGSHLGVGCSDTYGAAFNGTQSIMGPRSEINPWTGAFNYATSHINDPNAPPHTAISHRLQLHDADIDPAQHAGALFFADVYTVTHDDSNHMNSVSHEPVAINGAPGGDWSFDLSGPNSVNGPTINAWPGASLTTIPQTPTADGRCILGVKVTANGNGAWHYEYALYNHDMDRAVQSFSVPVGPGVTLSNMGFSAVRSHDEPFHNNPWPAVRAGGRLTWSTDPYNAGNSSNPIRWGTMYNFRFDATSAPASTTAILGLYKPGDPATLAGATQGPVHCAPDFNADGLVNSQDFFDFLAAFFASSPTADFNLDGLVNSQDFFDFLTAFFAGC